MDPVFRAGRRWGRCAGSCGGNGKKGGKNRFPIRDGTRCKSLNFRMGNAFYKKIVIYNHKGFFLSLPCPRGDFLSVFLTFFI